MQPNTATLHTLVPASAGREVQDGIRRIEGSIDAMMAEGAMLLAKSLRATQEAGVAPAFAHRAIKRQMSMLSTALEMRELAFTAHQDMRGVLKKVDLDVVGWGDMGPSPPMALDGAETLGG